MRVFGAVLSLVLSVVAGAQENGVISADAAKRQPRIAAATPALKPLFNATKCGLTYKQASAKLANRNSAQFPPVAQPASLAIAGIPANATIEKAFVWWVIEKQTGGASSVTLTNPAGATQTFAGTLIGANNTGGKCWSGPGTTGWRADVTAFITPPFSGVYMASGLPVSSQSTGLPDTDGVTLFIAYSVPGTGDNGTLVVNDGLPVSLGVLMTEQLAGFNASCPDPNAKTFVQLADFQGNGSTISINGGAPAGFTENFWDWEERTTPVITGQTSTTVQINPVNDCVAWQVLGLNYRCPETACKPCQQVVIQARKQYAAKFVCHRATENPLQVVRGIYGTTINVHNPDICSQPSGEQEEAACKPARFAKKVAIAFPGQKPGPISKFRLASLRPDEAFQIDCRDIFDIAGVSLPFLDGFLVIDSERPLDVTAVYTARPSNGEVSTIDVEDVRERDVKAVVSFCQ